MIVKSYTKTGKQERRLLIGMIIDRAVLGAVTQQWGLSGLFNSTWSNVVGSWCVEYYKKYKKPPRKEIESLFEEWAQNRNDNETIRMISSFLSSLSNQYVNYKKKIQSDYLIDLAGKYFTSVQLVRFSERINQAVEAGDIAEASKIASNYQKIELGLGCGINLLTDKEALKKAFEDKKEPLITYPGALGVFFGNSLERDGFISFEAPEKRGKTWILLDLAWKSLIQRRNVAFFQVGDLSQSQLLRRFAVRAMAHPMDVPDPEKIYRIPTFIGPPGEDESLPQITYKEYKFSKNLQWTDVRKCFKKLSTKYGDVLKLSTHANSSISVTGIENVLDGWSRQNWQPDVIIIDYADILAPIIGTVDSREQINQTWKALRRLSQERHSLVITATQTDAESYETELITMKNFTEDKRKRSHVTGSVGINQTSAEKDMGVYRLNWIVGREWEYKSDTTVKVAGCLAIGRPFMFSTF